MDSPHGRILAIDNTVVPPTAIVEVLTPVACPRCEAGRGCGAAVLGGGDRRREVAAVLAHRVEVSEGDRVVIELAPRNVLRAAAIVYGLPLCGAVAGAALAYIAGTGDAGAALMALAGAAAGIVLGRRQLRRAECLRQFTPHVTARLGDA